MPDTFGPIVGNTDYFKAEILLSLSAQGIVAPDYVDGWALHMKDGEVHCGSNTERTPITMHWWDAWQ